MSTIVQNMAEAVSIIVIGTDTPESKIPQILSIVSRNCIPYDEYFIAEFNHLVAIRDGDDRWYPLASDFRPNTCVVPDPVDMLGYCKECFEPIVPADQCLPDYPGIYQCSKCDYPNTLSDMHHTEETYANYLKVEREKYVAI